MATKRVTVRLSDDEINMLDAAMDAYLGDISASGDDLPEGSQELRDKLRKARSRVRST